MALQPVDMSTIYTQMDKVAKYNASQDSNLKLAQNIQNLGQLEKNAEQSKAVAKAAEDQAETTKLREDGKNPTGYDSTSENKNQQNQQEPEEESTPKNQLVIDDPLLGRHIDITR